MYLLNSEIIMGMAAGLFVIVVIDIIYFVVLFVSICLHTVLLSYKGNAYQILVVNLEVFRAATFATKLLTTYLLTAK